MSSKPPHTPSDSPLTPATDADGRPLPTPAVRDALYAQFARIGQAIANPTRLHLLSLLDQGEKTVETLTRQSGHPFATVSAHLKVLRDAHLVATRREGRHVVYRVANEDTVRLGSALKDVALRALPEVRELAETYYDSPSTMSQWDARELMAAVQRCEVVLVDLRPAEEFDAGHLPQARSIPFAELERRLSELPSDRPIVAYCRGAYCVMGVRGVETLRAQGFDVQRLPAGVADWRREGLPLEV